MKKILTAGEMIVYATATYIIIKINAIKFKSRK